MGYILLKFWKYDKTRPAMSCRVLSGNEGGGGGGGLGRKNATFSNGAHGAQTFRFEP